MANFKPMNNEILRIIDIFIEKEKINGHFLDVGGGDGDISLHLAKKGFEGTLIDFSKKAIIRAKKCLKGTKVKVQHKNILNVQETFNLILILDVLEHLPNDKKVIKHIYKILNDNGHIIISVPIRMKEWTWQDEELGHFRRYEIKDIANLLSNEKFKIKIMWDYTFPFFWLIRRIYTTTLNRKKAPANKLEKTKISGIKEYSLVNNHLRSKILWYPMCRINQFFRHRFWGIQVLILAQKRK